MANTRMETIIRMAAALDIALKSLEEDSMFGGTFVEPKDRDLIKGNLEQVIALIRETDETVSRYLNDSITSDR